MSKPGTVYLGWGNPRSAFSWGAHDLIILTDEHGEELRILRGELAAEARSLFRRTTEYLCGIGPRPEGIPDKNEVGDHRDLVLYNQIFDHYWEMAS